MHTDLWKSIWIRAKLLSSLFPLSLWKPARSSNTTILRLSLFPILLFLDIVDAYHLFVGACTISPDPSMVECCFQPYPAQAPPKSTPATTAKKVWINNKCFQHTIPSRS
ncbi:hypothetical protein BDV27DRAFT_129436 [Aspergillus caelatus]|uniref:Uncharacterized protein n=1 Tax=Aspergillus caelatus TaxID=61420 RepID=A0A5N7A3S9_9EURO|nr:uncharacterized protein BDV27DRAFT_129436 [Aspergillus caelatus]KAE8363839.1 hypothetical protein BDV27DRAFT_129436 [Aspergillus caelatus]